MFNTVRGNKISQEIIAQIRNMIFKGKLSPGDKLPPENILTEQFGVSRQTLREALRALEFIGLIEIRKGTGGGPSIAEMDGTIAEEMLANYLYFKNLSIRQLTDFRKMIEPQATAIAAETMTDDELKELDRLVQSAREASLDSYEVWNTGRFDLDFHTFIGQCTRNPMLSIIIDFVESVMVELKHHHIVEKKYYKDIFRAHERILTALKERDGVTASREMSDHIEDVQNHLLSMADTGVWENPATSS